MKIAIIGCGNMGKAFAERLSKVHSITLYDHNRDKVDHLTKQGFGKAPGSLHDTIVPAEAVILAIKPQSLDSSAADIAQELKENQLVISLLSGTPLSVLKEYFPKNRVVRMMPNLAIVCGDGILSLSADDSFHENERKLLSETFASLGHVYWILEDKKDAFTSLAGSGPAFFLAMLEAMVETGIMMGFPANESQKIASQMVQGTLSLLEYSHKHPADLKWQITSPQGTTIAGLKKFEENAVRAGIMNTFLAAFNRAQELNDKWKK